MLDHRVQPVPHHLGVAGLPEDAGEPGQLRAQRLADVAVQQRSEGPQGAAQAPGRDAHLVHVLRAADPHARVVAEDGVQMHPQVGLDHQGRRAVAGRLGRRGAGHLLQPTGQGARQLGGPGGRCRSGVAQCSLQLLEQVGVPLDELDLPLPPRVDGRGAVLADAVRRHRVVGQLGEDGAVAVPQPVHDPAGAQRGHRLDRVVTDEGSHLVQAALRAPARPPDPAARAAPSAPSPPGA